MTTDRACKWVCALYCVFKPTYNFVTAQLAQLDRKKRLTNIVSYFRKLRNECKIVRINFKAKHCTIHVVSSHYILEAMNSKTSAEWQYSVALVVPILILGLIRWYKRPKNFPPGPRGVPLLGAIPFMGRFPERTIKKWSKKYGPVMSVRMGTWDMVVLNDFDSVHKVRIR